jgi:hypothetical protein
MKEQGIDIAGAEQTAIPGTDQPIKLQRTRVSLLARGVSGDLVIAYGEDADHVLAIEQIAEHDAASIVERWRDLGIVGKKPKVEVWELRPGNYFRRRTSR